MTPPIHHLKSVWEIHLSLFQLITSSFHVSSLSQCYQIIGCFIHMFKSSLSETSIESAICSYPFTLCRPSLCPKSNCHILCFTFKLYYSFRVIDGGYIKALLWWVLFRWIQLIIWKQDLEILWYLGTCMPQWQVSSLLTVGLHHWPLTEIFHQMFDLNSFIHTRWIVLVYLGIHWH